jgi:hypothetical protein
MMMTLYQKSRVYDKRTCNKPTRLGRLISGTHKQFTSRTSAKASLNVLLIIIYSFQSYRTKTAQYCFECKSYEWTTWFLTSTQLLALDA